MNKEIIVQLEEQQKGEEKEKGQEQLMERYQQRASPFSGNERGVKSTKNIDKNRTTLKYIVIKMARERQRWTS